MKRSSRKGGSALASNYLLGAVALFLIPFTAFGGSTPFAPDYIRPITKVDARYSYSFTAFSADSTLTMGITNLFDRDAQRLPVAGGLETRIDDPFGRQFYMSLDFDLGG